MKNRNLHGHTVLCLVIMAAIAAFFMPAAYSLAASAADVDAGAQAFGETVSGAISAAGEADSYTIVANAGDAVLIRVSKDGGDLWPRLRLYAPGGALLQEQYGSTSAEVLQRVPESGSYNLMVSDGYDGTFTGSYKLYVQRLNQPGNALALTFGQTVTGAIPQAAEMDTFTFQAEAGDVVLVGMSRTSGSLWPEIRVYNASGSALGAAGGSVHAELIVTVFQAWRVYLPVVVSKHTGGEATARWPEPVQRLEVTAAGTYAILVGDGYNGTYTGSYDVHLQRLNNPGNATALSFGQTLAGSIGMAGEMDAYTFVGEAGDVVLAGMSKTSGTLWPQVRVYDPSGNPVGSTTGSAHTEVVARLSMDGTYLVLACDGYNGTYTGSYNVHLQRLNNPGNATALSFGQTLAGSIGMAGEMDAYTFVGGAGQGIVITMSRTSGSLWPQIRLYDAAGNPVGSANGSTSAELTVTLGADGTYTILAADGYNGTYTGEYNVHLE
jgi:hypothetical protein